MAAVDGREEPDAVAAEVVEEAIVAWMGTDDADTAVVVAIRPCQWKSYG